MICRICNNEAGNRSYEAAEMMFGMRDRFGYFQCAECGCLQIRDYPADVSKYYGPDYYSYNEGLAKTTFGQRLRTRLRDRYAVSNRGLLGRYFYNRESNSRLAHLAPVLQSRRRRILDVGCGSAALLRSLEQIGFHDVQGADAFIEGDFRFGRRGYVAKKTLAEVDASFDLVMLHHSLEHMPGQRDVFAHIARLLAPGGECVIAVPLSSSYAWEHYGVDWVQLDAPRHFYLHSVDSLTRLATAAGMKVWKIVFDSTALQFWGSEQYRRGIPLQDPRSLSKHSVDGSMFSRSQMGEYARRSVELNASGRGDQAMFFLRAAGS